MYHHTAEGVLLGFNRYMVGIQQHQDLQRGWVERSLQDMTRALWTQSNVLVKTYYCLRQAVGNDLIFEVEVIDPEDDQGDIQEEDSEIKT